MRAVRDDSLGRIDDPEPYMGARIDNPRLAPLSKIRKLDSLAYAYLAETASLLD